MQYFKVKNFVIEVLVIYRTCKVENLSIKNDGVQVLDLTNKAKVLLDIPLSVRLMFVSLIELVFNLRFKALTLHSINLGKLCVAPTRNSKQTDYCLKR